MLQPDQVGLLEDMYCTGELFHTNLTAQADEKVFYIHDLMPLSALRTTRNMLSDNYLEVISNHITAHFENTLAYKDRNSPVVRKAMMEYYKGMSKYDPDNFEEDILELSKKALMDTRGGACSFVWRKPALRGANGTWTNKYDTPHDSSNPEIKRYYYAGWNDYYYMDAHSMIRVTSNKAVPLIIVCIKREYIPYFLDLYARSEWKRGERIKLPELPNPKWFTVLHKETIQHHDNAMTHFYRKEVAKYRALGCDTKTVNTPWLSNFFTPVSEKAPLMTVAGNLMNRERKVKESVLSLLDYAKQKGIRM